MTALSMADQVARMRDLFPELLPTWHCSWWVTWTGQVRPLHRAYTISIQYIRRYWIGELEIINGYQPQVVVLEPQLIMDHPRTDYWLPHVYWRRDRPEHSTLCLYDPAASQWSPDDLIAETTVPWACEWLACYEGWLATGVWSGGGRHPRRREAEPCEVTESPNPAPPERALRDGFHRVGLRIGTFASLPLMVAASEGCFRPLSWRDWKNDTSVADLLLSASTSSPEPPQAASLRSDSPPVSVRPISGGSISSGAARFFRHTARESSGELVAG